MKQSWPEVPLYEICGAIVDCVNKTAPVVDEATPYRMIRTTNVKSGVINTETVRYVTKETYQTWTRRQVPRSGDVILTREAPLGEVGMLRNADGIFLGQRLMSYRADPDKLDAHFLLYALQGKHLQDQIRAAGSGATVEHMRVPDAEKLKIRLPPLSTQRKIAAVLSAYDDLIENNTRRVRVLEEIARAPYREWFVEYRFPGHETAEFVEDEQGRRPAGWEWAELKAIAPLVIRGIAPKYSENSEDLVINQKCIRNQRLSLTSARHHSGKVPAIKMLRFGDILINSTGVGTLGRVAQVYQEPGNLTVDTHVTIVRPDLEQVGLDYFGLTLMDRQPEFEAAGVGSTGQTELGRERIGSISLLIPELELQESFGAKVQPLRHLVEQLLQRNANLRLTRDFLLPQLVSGELDVSALDIRGSGLEAQGGAGQTEEAVA